MPQHKSCKKRMKTDAERRERNRAARSTLRRTLRKFGEMSPEERAANYSSLVSTLDKAATRGVIPANRASRLKSRLAPSA